MQKFKNLDKKTLQKYALFTIIELLIVGVIVAVDLLTKEFVYGPLKAENNFAVVIKDFLYFDPQENTGAAFSIFSGNAHILSYVSLVAALLLVVILAMSAGYRNLWLRSGLILILGGAIGNMVDRFAFGYVRDFVDLDSIFDWVGVFNVADSAITVGTVVIIIYVIFFYNKDMKAAEAEKTATAVSAEANAEIMPDTQAAESSENDVDDE